MNESDVTAVTAEETHNVSGYSQDNTNSQTDIDTPKLTPIEHRKRDALDFAELIYKIYNENCPAPTKEISRKGNKNV